jgi:type II secretory pathway pseudopilin PulG
MMFRNRQRGSALLAALIVIGVLALVTVATLQLANISKQASAKDARKLSQTSCVEAARQYLLSRLRLFGVDPTSLSLDQTIQLDSGSNGGRRLYTGHIRAVDANGNPTGSGTNPGGTIAGIPVVKSVMALPPSLISNNTPRARDISNVIAQPTMGGKAYRVVVACADPLAGDMELEFTFKYGL